MPRLLIPCLLAVLVSGRGCGWPADRPAAAVEVSAVDLHRAFRADPDAARREFEGKDLTIVGEVVRASARFRGTTMSGEVTVPAQILLETGLDSLPGDIKYVQVEGRFDAPGAASEWTLDPRVREGESIRVSCPRAVIRWTDPGLYVTQCGLAAD